MMRTIYFLFFSLVISFTVNAQDDALSAKTALKKSADNMNHALVNRKYATFVKSTYPKALEKTSGGEEKLIQDLQRQVGAMEQQGSRIIAAWIGEPSPFIDTAGELQCTVPQKMALQFETGKLTTETTLLAISPDKGKTWYFMDAADRDIQTMRTIFPNLSSRLVLTKSPDPTFEPTPEKAPAKATPSKK